MKKLRFRVSIDSITDAKHRKLSLQIEKVKGRKHPLDLNLVRIGSMVEKNEHGRTSNIFFLFAYKQIETLYENTPSSLFTSAIILLFKCSPVRFLP